ncbi:MAG: sarcosine oxidase subunit delta [Mesorhizobium sp.]|nr:sarcosine oxidase subunit delta [Mesorhizobium sp.]MBL8576023.1 sarcosine oxidase subunit delta [Mesorhizobium sp.]
MIITCPFCGPRDSSEFVYREEGGRTRPDPASTDQAAWNAYVYERVNTAGDHEEIWQHSGGCRSHLRVLRNTVTHKILDVTLARETGKAEKPA